MAGAAYIFRWTGTTWSQQTKIQAGDAEASDYFGYSVSISSDGNSAVVGAYQEDIGGYNAGAAYIFKWTGTIWTEQAKIQASDKEAGDNFGYSVSISSDGNTTLIGAYSEDTGGGNAGAAYIFKEYEVMIPNHSNFTSTETTNFSEGDVTNVTSLILAIDNKGKIAFPSDHSINAENEDYNTNVKIEDALIYVNSAALDSSFNHSVTLTFEGVNCNAPYVYYSATATTRAAVLAEDTLCPSSICTNIQCTGSTLTVDVAHFTGYAVNGSSNLTIDADDPKFVLDDVTFSAWYRNSTSGIIIQGATCNISFPDGSSAIMDEQTGVKYNYTRTFASAQIVDYNVTCTHINYDPVFAEDIAVINAVDIPEFSTITLGMGLIAVLGGLFIIRKKR